MQFCQIRQAVYRELLGIALASRRKGFNISANFLPLIRSSLGVKGAHRLVGFQNEFNHVIHCKHSNINALQFSQRTILDFARQSQKSAVLSPRPLLIVRLGACRFPGLGASPVSGCPSVARLARAACPVRASFLA